MKTTIRHITGDKSIDKNIISEAASIIKKGGIAVFPTETVYGIGADAFNEEACERIYGVKKRPADKPLIVLISDMKDLEKVARDVPDAAYDLMERFWPGPLSIILKKNENVPDIISGGTDTIAVRFTSGETIRKIISQAGTPIVAPSANISGAPAPMSADEAIRDFEGIVDMIIEDDGAIAGGESTIVDVSDGDLKVVREGIVQVKL